MMLNLTRDSSHGPSKLRPKAKTIFVVDLSAPRHHRRSRCLRRGTTSNPWRWRLQKSSAVPVAAVLLREPIPPRGLDICTRGALTPGGCTTESVRVGEQSSPNCSACIRRVAISVST